MPGKAANSERTYRVFISHATYDKWVATVLCEKIEMLGATTFRDDRDIAGGDSIPEAIQFEIRDSDEVLVLLSPQSLKRQWIYIEIGMAVAFQKRIVPLMFHIPAKQIPDIIRNQRGFDLDNFDGYLADVAARVASFRS
ncbi:MAG TPA: toll/interleukin-1 receptor domain-containing protein [Caulifigura sp.]|nr:toll/interleukin-1 receptor domain-containing protein [Caulifigura sp.]